MVSPKAIRQSLYEKLNTASVTSLLASGSASIFHGVASPTAIFPYLIYHQQSGVAVDRFGGLAYDSQLWLVKAVTRGEGRPVSSAAEDIHVAVSNLLDFGTLTITGGSLMHMARESDVAFIETDGDIAYSHRGALYRVSVQDS